jgi:hypothetical protein
MGEGGTPIRAFSQFARSSARCSAAHSSTSARVRRGSSPRRTASVSISTSASYSPHASVKMPRLMVVVVEPCSDSEEPENLRHLAPALPLILTPTAIGCACCFGSDSGRPVPLSHSWTLIFDPTQSQNSTRHSQRRLTLAASWREPARRLARRDPPRSTQHSYRTYRPFPGRTRDLWSAAETTALSFVPNRTLVINTRQALLAAGAVGRHRPHAAAPQRHGLRSVAP